MATQLMPPVVPLHPMAAISTASAIATSDWRKALPVVTAPAFTLRELRLSDATSLLTFLSTEEVTRFISPPPSTVDGFERFILWTHRERAAGRFICFGIVPADSESAVGLFQIRSLETDFGTAEWGFAMGSAYWGSGIFAEAAHRVMEIAFDTIGVRRLEARAAVQNGRGNGALQKIGALREGILHRSFMRNGEHLDQILWAIDADDWRRARFARGRSVH